MVIGGVVPYISIYVVYAFIVAANEVLRKHTQKLKLDAVTSLLPEKGSFFSCISEEGDDSMNYSMLDDYASNTEVIPHLQTSKVPQWIWAPNVAFYSSHNIKYGPEGPKFVWGWIDEEAITLITHVSNPCYCWMCH